MDNILNRIWRILPGILGIVEVVFPLVREIVIAAVRIWAVFNPQIEKKIPDIKKFFDGLETAYEKVKNFFL